MNRLPHPEMRRQPDICMEIPITETRHSGIIGMAIDIEAVRAQQRELNMVSDEISFVKRKLERHQEALDDAWKSMEIKGIDSAIEDVVYRLNRLSKDLEDLSHDVMVTGEEIRAEEEAEAAEAEAARRLAVDGKI